MTDEGEERADGRLTALRVAAELSEQSTLCLPVGSLEQHGPHLPLDTDTVIADASPLGWPRTSWTGTTSPAWSTPAPSSQKVRPDTRRRRPERVRGCPRPARPTHLQRTDRRTEGPCVLRLRRR